MAQHSWGTSYSGPSPATLSERPGTPSPAAHRLLSLDIVLALLALAGGLRVLYLAATTPALPAESANVAHAYALGHFTPFTDAGGAGVSPFGWWQLSAYTMVTDAPESTTAELVASLPHEPDPGDGNRLGRGLTKIGSSVVPGN